jgi:hypothetical protein
MIPHKKRSRIALLNYLHGGYIHWGDTIYMGRYYVKQRQSKTRDYGTVGGIDTKGIKNRCGIFSMKVLSNSRREVQRLAHEPYDSSKESSSTIR